MGYRLGVDLGTTYTAAVVHRPGTAPTVVSLGERAATMPSVLFLGADGTVLVGEPAERRAVTDPERVVRRFKRRIGDETPLLVGAAGDGLTAHAIAAKMIALVADRVAEQEGGAPDAIAVTIPAAWVAHKKELLTGALVREGLLGVTLVSEPAAAALAYADTGRLAAGSSVAVYDFGGGTFDAALLRAETDGRFTPVGSPSGLPNLGGIDFDDAVLAYVLGTAGPQTPGVDLDDPLHVTAMARLRRECVDAKEALSADTTATVPVLLGGAQTSVRLTRGEFEAMIAGAVEETCISLEAALVSAGLTSKNLDRILLTGGSSRIPLVTQLLSARYPAVTLERDIDPKLAVATGAVLALELASAPPVVPVGGGHVAPQPMSEPETVDLTAAAAAGTTARPERPALEREGFIGNREPGVPVIASQKRKTPTVLMVAASLIMAGGFGLSQFSGLELELGNALPGVQEARAGTDRGDASELEVESAKGAKADAADTKTEEAGTTDSSESAASDTTDNSAQTASRSTEGSADKRSAESSGSEKSSDASTADTTSEKKAVTKDQAAPARKSARSDKASKADQAQSGDSAGAPAAEQAAPAAAAAPAPAAEDTSTDSGSVEFNDGGSAGGPTSP
jgi:hypothetical protein